jgi:hypothetical protein
MCDKESYSVLLLLDRTTDLQITLTYATRPIAHWHVDFGDGQPPRPVVVGMDAELKAALLSWASTHKCMAFHAVENLRDGDSLVDV